jgi:hypothetical protein
MEDQRRSRGIQFAEGIERVRQRNAIADEMNARAFARGDGLRSSVAMRPSSWARR